MLVFHNAFFQALTYVSTLALVAGLLRFIVQVARGDADYEKFLAFPIRLLIYVGYMLIPGSGIVVGVCIYVFSKNRVHRKFAAGSIYVSAAQMLCWSSLYFGAGLV